MAAASAAIPSSVIEDDKLHYVHNYVGAEEFHVELNTTAPEGLSVKLRYEFEPTGKPDLQGRQGRGPARGSSTSTKSWSARYCCPTRCRSRSASAAGAPPSDARRARRGSPRSTGRSVRVHRDDPLGDGGHFRANCFTTRQEEGGGKRSRGSRWRDSERRQPVS